MLVWGRITCRYFFTWGKVDFWWNHNFVFGIFPESVSFLKQEWVSELRCASCSFGGSINSCISWNWVLLRFHLYIYVDFMGANQFFSPNKTSFISISCNPNCKRNILQLFRISNSAGWFFGDFDLADAIIDISGWIQRFGSKKKHVSYEKNPVLLSIESWLFNRDPYNGLFDNPYIIGFVWSPTTTPTNQGFFFIAHVDSYPSSHKQHGFSVENGCISNSSCLPNTASFHWSVIFFWLQ